MKISQFCYKACATCVVLVIAIYILYKLEIAGFIYYAKAIGLVGGIALVIGIIASIWEK